MSMTIEQDFLFLEQRTKPKKVMEAGRRRRTISTSFEQTRSEQMRVGKILSEEWKTTSYGNNLTKLAKQISNKPSLISFNSIPEEQLIISQGKFGNFTELITNLPGLGIILITLCILLFQMGNVLAKQTNVDPFLLLLFRNVLLISNHLPSMVVCTQSLFPKGRRLLLLLRGMIGGINMIVLFYTLKVLPLGDVTMIGAIKPVCITFLSCVFLKESLGVFEVINLILVISGIVLVVQPPILFGEDNSEYTSHMFLTALAFFTSNAIGGVDAVMLRYFREMEWVVLSINYQCVLLVENIVILAYNGVFCLPSCEVDRLNIAIIAFLQYLANVLAINSFKYEEAHILGMVDNAANILISQIFQAVFFSTFPTWLKGSGVALVLFSIILIGGKRIWESKKHKAEETEK